GWFIFTTLLLLVTLRSTVAFFSLFFFLDLAFLMLGIGYLHPDAKNHPNPPIIKAGGFFGLLAAFLAWYNALAGMADDSNRCVPILLSSPFFSPFSPPSRSLLPRARARKIASSRERE
ncbi:MAG: hypothetical protein LQ346_009104, partial [Caloplaca aetnensis]